MKVVKITHATEEKPIPVYDVTIPTYENFCLGNGIVVHNSKDIADSLAGAHWNCATAPVIFSANHMVSSFLEGTKPETTNDKLKRFLIERPRQF